MSRLGRGLGKPFRAFFNQRFEAIDSRLTHLLEEVATARKEIVRVEGEVFRSRDHVQGLLGAEMDAATETGQAFGSMLRTIEANVEELAGMTRAADGTLRSAEVGYALRATAVVPAGRPVLVVGEAVLLIGPALASMGYLVTGFGAPVGDLSSWPGIELVPEALEETLSGRRFDALVVLHDSVGDDPAKSVVTRFADLMVPDAPVVISMVGQRAELESALAAISVGDLTFATWTDAGYLRIESGDGITGRVTALATLRSGA